MQAELTYYGKFRELSYLDDLPWNQFMWFHRWLRDVKKKEAEEQKKSQMKQEQAMASARSRTRRPPGR